MKNQLKNFALPIGMGILLLIITIMGVVSTTLVGCKKTSCSSGECLGTDGKCYTSKGCQNANPNAVPALYCSTTGASGNKHCSSSPNNVGIYCCQTVTSSGGGGGGGGGCNSVMGCCPVTGCGTDWYSSVTGACYSTKSDCLSSLGTGGSCRQCY